MIVQCEHCQTKYRLDDSKVGEKGVKVRCTKCQNTFIVQKEAPPQVEAVPPVPSAPSAPVSEPAQPPAPTFEKKEMGLGEDFQFGFEEESGGKAPPTPPPPTSFGEEGFSFEAEKPAEEPKKAGGFEFEVEKKGGGTHAEHGSGDFEFEVEKKTEGAEKEETVIFSIGAQPEAKGAGTTVSEKTVFAGFGVHEKEEKEETPQAKEEEKAATPPVSKGAKSGKLKWLILILLLVAVLLYGGIKIIYDSGAMTSLMGRFSGPAEQALLDVENVTGTFVDNQELGSIFAIEGKIKNSSETPQEIRLVIGVIYDKEGEAVASSAVSPGRILSSEQLKTLSGDEIEKHFEDTSGGVIPPKGTIPAMIVFTELPPDMAEIEIQAIY